MEKRLFAILLIACFSLLLSCGRKSLAVECSEDEISSLSVEEKVGQMLMVSIPGKSINKAASDIIDDIRPGGVILFGYNVSSMEGVKQYIKDLQNQSAAAKSLPLFVSMDQEGGRVVRLKDGVTQFPGNMAAGVSGDAELVYSWGRILGTELGMCGVNMNLAPDVDVNNNPANPVINTRSFGSDPVLVSKLGAAYIRGLQESGCAAVAKHFPGHGDTDTDSHRSLPVVRHRMERLEQVELMPFRKAVESGVDCVMTAHIAFPEIVGSMDSATISPFFLTEVLRKRMNFRGIVMTDDMEMNAVSKRIDIGEAAMRSVEAGADIVLISSYGKNIRKIRDALMNAYRAGRLTEMRINESVKRVMSLKLTRGIMKRNGREFVSAEYNPGEEGASLLKKAASVNRELSEKGLLCVGDASKLKSKDFRKIFVSRSKALAEEIKNRTGSMVHETLTSAMKEAGSVKGALVVLHAESFSIRALRKAAGELENAGCEPVVISTGNPFPVAAALDGITVLYTFSTTAESMRAAAGVFSGEIIPAQSAPLMLTPRTE